jgi:hypothetical protein
MKISPLTVQSKKAPQFERSKDDAIGEITQRGNTDKKLHTQNGPGKERHGALKIPDCRALSLRRREAVDATNATAKHDSDARCTT